MSIPDSHPPPERTWSTISGSSSEEAHPTVGIPALLGLLQDATKYHDILLEGELDPHPSDSERSSLSDSTTTEETPDPSIKDFPLESKRIQPLARIEKLAVNAYNEVGPALGDGPISETSSITAASDDLEALNDRVVPLLVQDFGPMAEEGEEERLLVETDGAYYRDVAILGLIHLTTHRITFHASLLSTRPDVLPDVQIIKSGPVVIHRTGLHRKRRVWLELSHDMLCTFPDATDEGRVRPIRSILLSDIQEVHPQDPRDPMSMRMTFKTKEGVRKGHVEFDTIESAASWRKETTVAVHLNRRRRSELYRGDDSEGQAGVRIAIPLHRIDSFECRGWGSFATVVTFSLGRGATLERVESIPHRSFSESPQDTIRTLTDRTEANPEYDVNTLTMTVITGVDFEALAGHIKAAKDRRLDHPTTIGTSDQVVVDFGSLAFDHVDPGAIGTEGDHPEHSKDLKSLARTYFGISNHDDLWSVKASMGRFITSTGYLMITSKAVCFLTKGLVIDQKLRFAIKDVNSAHIPEEKRPCDNVFHRFALEVRGHKEIIFSFGTREIRDDAMARVNAAAGQAKGRRISHTPSSSVASTFTVESATSLMAASKLTATPPRSPTLSTTPSVVEELASIDRILERARNRYMPTEILPHVPRPINLPSDTQFHIKPQHFVCLTIGSRGDVQPYIALCLGLKNEGHSVTIVTHEEYKAWVEGFGIHHRTAGGDPGALMKLSVEHKLFSPQFFKESLGHYRKWLDDLLMDSYTQVKEAGATVLIESPSAMAGIHIAESLNIPYFRAFTMPWSRTAEYPHAFISPPEFVSGSLNFSSYVLFDNVFWLATAPQINPWRRNVLGLGNTDLEHLAQTKIPFLYNFSPSVVPKPMDWIDSTIITGYWFLDNPDLGWTPPQSMLDFIAKARMDRKPLVYIGFGSIVVQKPKAMTRSIVKAVLKSDVRAILNKGWSARMATEEDAEAEVQMPPEVYEVDKVPHDWLFPQIDAALHHGGAGTTGASLRAGIPTLIKPWFGDQFFWASRVQKLGAGLRVPSLNSSDLASALTKATSDRVIRERAQAVGEKIREESGVATAIRSLYTYLHRAGLRPRTEKRGSVDLTAAAGHVSYDDIPVEHDILSVMGGPQNHRASTI